MGSTLGEINRVRSIHARAGFAGNTEFPTNPAFAVMAAEVGNPRGGGVGGGVDVVKGGGGAAHHPREGKMFTESARIFFWRDSNPSHPPDRFKLYY